MKLYGRIQPYEIQNLRIEKNYCGILCSLWEGCEANCKINTGQSRNKMRLHPVLYLFMSNSWNKSASVLAPGSQLPRPDPC